MAVLDRSAAPTHFPLLPDATAAGAGGAGAYPLPAVKSTRCWRFGSALKVELMTFQCRSVLQQLGEGLIGGLAKLERQPSAVP